MRVVEFFLRRFAKHGSARLLSGFVSGISKSVDLGMLNFVALA